MIDVVTKVIKRKKSFLLGEKKVADTVYLTQDDLEELNKTVRNNVESTNCLTIWTDVHFGDKIFGMEIVETGSRVKSTTVIKLLD